MSKSPRYFIQLPVKTAEQKDINSTDKLVFGEIHTVLNANKYFFMSSKKLGFKIGINPRTVIRSIEKLNQLGYVDVHFDRHDSKNHKRYIYHDRPLGTAQSVSTSHDKMSHGTAQSVSTSPVQNVTVENKKRTLDRRQVKNLSQQKAEKDFKEIDKFVQDKWLTSIPSNKRFLIDRLISHYGYKAVANAMTTTYDNSIGIMGMPKYTASVLRNNAHKPKRRSHKYYGRKPIKHDLPDWAKDNYHVKLHPTSKKQNEKVQRMLKNLNQNRKK